MERATRPASLRDVAREAGVSRTTASRALTGQPKVSREALEAVLAAAKRLDYRADPIARALRSRSTNTVGMVVPVVGNPFFAELVHGVERALDSNGSQLLLADSAGKVELERRKLQLLVEHKVDGIVLVPSDHVRSAEAIAAYLPYTPIVQVDRRVDTPTTDYVGTDNRIGMRLVVEHLQAIGVRTAVLVSADDENSVGRNRRLMFEEAAAATSIELRPGLFHDFSVEHGRRSAEALLADPPLPDAIVAGSDVIAFGLVSTLVEGGVDVPGDTLVVGYDGTDLAEIFNPPLTTVEQPVAEIATKATELLRARQQDRDTTPASHEIPPTLRVRRSSTRRR